MNSQNISVLGKIWHNHEVNEHAIIKLKQKFNISDLLAQILFSKNLSDEAIQEFLYPKLKNLLLDPFHLKDMESAVEKVINALKQNKKICVFADYDVDGATSSALFKNVFNDLGSEILIYVPDRIEEGYGPTVEAMVKLKNRGIDLVITVDCGAAAKDILVESYNLGLEIIVIDHHLSAENFPATIPVINPNRIDETSPYTYIAAVGVAFLFAVALTSRMKLDPHFSAIKQPNLLQYLDLVAIGTICDVMPLTGINRCFVKLGLKVIKQRQNLGLKVLCDQINIKEAIGTYHVGFIIGPRINAGGRVGNAAYGARLLSTTDEIEATKLAAALENFNKERRFIEDIALKEAFEIAENKKDNALIFIAGKNWHPGIIGIIAGRVKDKYHKPVAVVTIIDQVCKASCRSVKGINLGAIIAEAKIQGLVTNGGGHAMAAGFTAEFSELDHLEEFLIAKCEKALKQIPQDEVKYFDGQLHSSHFNPELAHLLETLEPFGNGNNEPIFKISNLYVVKADIVGDQHVSCLLGINSNEINAKVIKAIAFRAIDSEIAQVLLCKKRKNFSVFGNIKINKWNGVESFQLVIQDIIFE